MEKESLTSSSSTDTDDDILETDDELWKGNQKNISSNRQAKDKEASAKLLQIIEKHKTDVFSKSTKNKRAVFERIVEDLRQVGVGLSNKPSKKSWHIAAKQWDKLKENYKKFRDNAQSTGRGAKETPDFYEELHALLGKLLNYTYWKATVLTLLFLRALDGRDSIEPKQLSTSLGRRIQPSSSTANLMDSSESDEEPRKKRGRPSGISMQKIQSSFDHLKDCEEVSSVEQ